MKTMPDMITRTYDKPFHAVVLHYQQGKAETDFERELVKRYHAFIDQMSDMCQRMEALSKAYQGEQQVIERHDAETKKFKRGFKALLRKQEKLAKDGEGPGIEMNEFSALKEKFHQLTDSYMDYHHGPVNEWRDVVNANEAEFDLLYQWFDKEEMDKAHDYFDGYAKELYRNYDNYALDLCRWDDDVDDMHGKMDRANDQWLKLFDLREETVALQNPVANRLAKVNELVEHLDREFNSLNDSRLMFNN